MKSEFDPNEEYIIASAVWNTVAVDPPQVHQPRNVDHGFIVFGIGHHVCMEILSRVIPGRDHAADRDGFLTSKHRFVDRKEGLEIAKKIGQIREDWRPKLSDELFSENMFY